MNLISIRKILYFAIFIAIRLICKLIKFGAVSGKEPNEKRL